MTQPPAHPEPVPEATGDRVILLTRTACQLCGPARRIVAEVCANADVGWVERGVDADSELRMEYGDRVPVVLLDGEEWASLCIDAGALAHALTC